MSLIKECVYSMVQSSRDAALKDAQMGPSEEECALDTGHIAILKTNPLHSDQNTRILLLQPSLFPISVLLDLHSFFQVR